MTHQEDPDSLEWIDRIRTAISERRGGEAVSRSMVIRWCVRRARTQTEGTWIPSQYAAEI